MENTIIVSAIPKDVAFVLDSGFEGIQNTLKKMNINKIKNGTCDRGIK
uniref:Uncharacterized protein n=1 Tax=Leptospira santarosai serovar Arenal str. MAVJ 401 TaxID=1049976 RepID=M6JM97_9LEPT|nr:hypothetical protein LEP1GSC063_3355 [Leptospira santarosai serovar Arenal str. MAVJ 401]